MLAMSRRIESMTYLRLATRRIGGVLLALAVLIGPAVAAESEAERAAAFVRQLGDKAIAKLSDSSVPYEKRVKHFRTLIHEGFAMEAISRFVLGRYWRVASEAEQKAFRDTFLDVIAQRFLPLFEGYSEDDFKVDAAKTDPRNPEIYLVVSRVRQPQSDAMVKAGWRVREIDGEMKIVDVLAEGVSMAITLRSEYGSVIQRNGGQVSALIEMLQANVEKGAYRPESVEGVVQ